jgi:hypothetical protein
MPHSVETLHQQEAVGLRTPAESNMKTRSDQTLVHDLRELIAALDRRVPSLERDGECDIARDAQALRRAALKRIAEVERSLSPPAIGTVGSVIASE